MSISVNQRTSKGLIKDTHWFNGLAPGFDRVDAASDPGNNNLKFGRDGSYANSRGVNPFQFHGPITPGEDLTELTNVSAVSSLINSFVVSDVSGAQVVYALEVSTKLHEINYTNDTIANAGSWPHTITAHGGHSAVAGEDLTIYDIGGTKYVLYSWNDNTDGDVGRLDLGGTTFDDDYMSTVPTGGAALGTDSHPMIVGDNGFHYTADGNSIHKFDGTGPTFTASVIDLPLGWVIKDMVKFRGFTFIGAVFLPGVGTAVRKEVAVYVWNYSSTSDFADIIPIDAIDFFAFKISNGQLKCHTRSRDNRTQLRVYDGKKFKPVDYYSIEHRPKNKHSISNYRNMDIWLAAEDTTSDLKLPVLTQGEYDPRLGLEESSAKIATFNDLKEGGAMTETLSAKYYFSCLIDTGSAYTIGKFGGVSGGSELFSRVYELPANSQIDYIDIFWIPISGSITTDLTIDLYRNQSATSFKTLTVDGDVHTNNVSRGFKDFDIGQRNTHAIQYRIGFPSTQDYKVTRVEIGFSLTEQRK